LQREGEGNFKKAILGQLMLLLECLQLGFINLGKVRFRLQASVCPGDLFHIIKLFEKNIASNKNLTFVITIRGRGESELEKGNQYRYVIKLLEL
jgi:hypothetical protein